MACTLVALALLFVPQSTPQIEVVRSTISGSPTSLVPGFPGVELTSLRTAAISPSGRYLLIAEAMGSTPETFLLIDDGRVLADQGVAPWTNSDVLNLADARTAVAANDGGEFFLTTEVEGAGSSKTVWVARLDSQGWRGLYSSAAPIPGAPGVFFKFFSKLNALDDGGLAFQANLRGVATSTDRVLAEPPTVLERSGVTGPRDPLTGTQLDHWFDWSHFLMTPDGFHHLAVGMVQSVTSPTLERLTVDGGQVMAEQQVLPGSGFVDPIAAILHVDLAPDGTWCVTGANDSSSTVLLEEFWVTRNARLLAQTGDLVLTGSTRSWHSGSGSVPGFQFAVSNGVQTYLAGVAEDGNTHEVRATLVLDRKQIVLEEGDPIDLDGNGIFDDSLEFVGFGNWNWAKVDRLGRLWFLASLRDTISGEHHEALLRVATTPIDLIVPPLVAGQNATIEVRQAGVGSQVVLYYSLAGAGPSNVPSPLGRLALDVGRPFSQTPPSTVPGSRRVQFPILVPAALSGASVWAQAVSFDAPIMKPSRPFAGVIQ